jgi:hypothetical protein
MRFAATLTCLVMLIGACGGGPRAGSKPVGSKSPGPQTWLAETGPRVVHIRDRAGDVFDHTGHHAPGQGAVDLVDVTVTADATGLTVVFTCQENIPKTSGLGAYEGKNDALKWGTDFWFAGNLDDERRYFQLGAVLVGTEWHGEIGMERSPSSARRRPDSSSSILFLSTIRTRSPSLSHGARR